MAGEGPTPRELGVDAQRSWDLNPVFARDNLELQITQGRSEEKQNFGPRVVERLKKWDKTDIESVKFRPTCFTDKIMSENQNRLEETLTPYDNLNKAAAALQWNHPHPQGNMGDIALLLAFGEETSGYNQQVKKSKAKATQSAISTAIP